MFFDQGLSGLNAAAQSLNVLGKNIANGSTVGYKTARVNFTDTMANTLNTASSGVSLQTGAGPVSSNIQQLFTQGTITTTTNPLDVAINGRGFYQLTDPTTSKVSYTRDGQFQVNNAGNLVAADGQKVSGYAAVGGVVGAAIVPLNLSGFGTFQGNAALGLTADANSPLSGYSINPDGTIVGTYAVSTSLASQATTAAAAIVPISPSTTLTAAQQTQLTALNAVSNSPSTQVTLGQLVLASFPSETGLSALGTNSWVQTSQSGAPTIGAPGVGGLGALQSSAVETSNEDQTSDMVGLLAAQRAYQANAQTIKAEDQMAQTLVNLG